MLLSRGDLPRSPFQTHLPLATPASHGLGLHPAPRHGSVVTWEKVSGRARRKVQPDEDLALELSGLAGKPDCFITVNEFYQWPKVRLLKRLRALYVDLDDCSSVGAALHAAEDACLPRPSYAIESGNGVHLYWLLEPVTAPALPVWQAVMQRLISLLATVGADPAARDCTRFLRLAGTVNSKVDREVRGFVIDPSRWTLRQISNEVLGYRAPGFTRIGSGSKKRTSAAVRTAIAPFDLWHRRYIDLCTIAERCSIDGSGVPCGHRDKLLFLLANALSWFTNPSSLNDEIVHIAHRFTPTLSDVEVAAYTRPIIERAQLAAEGKKVTFQGVQRDARYHFKTCTILEWLGELITPDVEKDLKVLLPRSVLDEREAARQKTRDRVKEGRYAQSREAYLATVAARRRKAFELFQQGLTQSEIANRFKVTPRCVRTWIKREEKCAPPV